MTFKYSVPLLGGILMIVLLWAAVPALALEKPSDEKIAVVNGAVITRHEFDREMTMVQQKLGRGGKVSDDELSAVKEKVLEGLINKELIYQESQKKGIKVEKKAIAQRLEAVKARFPNEEQFKTALAGMNLSEQMLSSQIEKSLAVQELIDSQFTRVTKVNDDETKAFYDGRPELFQQEEQVRASHILIKVSPTADAAAKSAARDRIATIRKRLEKGEDFAALAKELSEGPSAPRGGDLGYFTMSSQMVPPFKKSAFALKAGEVSDLVETQFGYHLIKVTDKRAEGKIPYKDIEQRIRNHLIQQKVQKEVNLYINRLKEGADVKTFSVSE